MQTPIGLPLSDTSAEMTHTNSFLIFRLTLWVMPYLRPELNKTFRDIEAKRIMPLPLPIEGLTHDYA